MTKWTQEETSFLLSNYADKGVHYCATQLNRTPNVITSKAKRLNLKVIKVTDRRTLTNQTYDERLFEGEIDFLRLGNYTTSRQPILHECYLGHTFNAAPNNILSGMTHCPHCSKRGLQHDKPTLLYLISFPYKEVRIYKLGITNRSVSERYRSENIRHSMKVEWELKYSTGTEANKIEQSLLKQYNKYLCNTNLLKYGNTETLTIYVDNPQKEL